MERFTHAVAAISTGAERVPAQTYPGARGNIPERGGTTLPEGKDFVVSQKHDMSQVEVSVPEMEESSLVAARAVLRS